MGNPDEPDAPPIAQPLKRPQMRAPVDQIMDLQDVDVVGLEEPEGVVDLRFTLGTTVAPDLVAN
jgi:hypothetical protein